MRCDGQNGECAHHYGYCKRGKKFVLKMSWSGEQIVWNTLGVKSYQSFYSGFGIGCLDTGLIKCFQISRGKGLLAPGV